LSRKLVGKLPGLAEEREDETMGRSSAAATLEASPRTSKVETRRADSHRDTVEAIIVAFILALVVRGFEAQAFVIPTGSMAPTLMGRHKEIACPQCGFLYAVNASEEVELRSLSRNVHSGICANCRYQARLDETPSFKGDRILVMMFPYDLPYLPGSGHPERWDVVVFRYPEEPEVSYIKRLVGLPGETIRIFHGDIFVKGPESDRFLIARKPWKHQTAMQITAYDDRHRPRVLAGKSEWLRWGSENGWKIVEPAVSRYQTDGGAQDQWAELRYRHLVPDPEQWDALLDNRTIPRPPRSTLITDFYSYNTNMSADSSNLLDDPRGDQEGAWMQPHWVGDLTLESTIDVSATSPNAALRFELIKGGIPHRCTIDLGTGVASFTRGDQEIGTGETPIRGAGRYQVAFANVDDGMNLSVNGTLVREKPFIVDADPELVPIPTEADLVPAAVGVRNATVVASDLVLKRDIYYTQYPGRLDYGVVWEDHYPRNPAELFDFLSDPSRFPSFAKVKSHEYTIGQERFFMMGDNSPRSKDSRGWGSDDSAWDSTDRKPWEVPRQLLTGKAFYVYWPHGYPVWPNIGINRDIRLTFRPYVERMKWIR
jgi:signal peptidase I